jgi:hypothetical protein
MSTLYGKVLIDGVATIGNEKVFVLQFLQARDPDWVRKPFFAKFDSSATWFDTLKPAFGEANFFFQNPGEDKGEAVPRNPIYLRRENPSDHQLTLTN